MISKALLRPHTIKCVFLCAYMLSSEVGGKLDYSPVSWREYFDQMEDVNVGPADSNDIFRIYKAGSDGPLLVLLHGGGHSALSWAVFTVSINATTSTNEGTQIISCLLFQTAISSQVTCRILAMDLRGHGEWSGDAWQTPHQTRTKTFHTKSALDNCIQTTSERTKCCF